jgi:putative ABC transport system permease protein
MFMELATLAIHNLLRARARLAMTAGGVLVGTAAVILLVALTVGLQNSAEAQIGSSASLTEIQVYPGWSPQPDTKLPQLDFEAVRAFSRLKGVLAVIPQLNVQFGGQLKTQRYDGYAQIVGVDARLLPYMGLEAQAGQLALEPGQALFGNQVPNAFYDPKSTDYQPVSVDVMTEKVSLVFWNSTGTERKVTAKPAGVLAPNPNYDYMIIIPIQDAVAYNEWGSNTPTDLKTFTYSQVLVRAENRETTLPLSEEIRQMGYSAGGMGDYLNSINGFFTTMRLMLGGVGGVALLVAAFGVANTMTMAILERTREIGLMKAVGATDSNILTIFLVEAGLVGFVGGLAGVGVSLAIGRLINESIANAPTPEPGTGGGGVGMFLPVDLSNLQGGLVVIQPELILFALGLATAVGTLAGLYPAYRAARMTTVVALKTD